MFEIYILSLNEFVYDVALIADVSNCVVNEISFYSFGDYLGIHTTNYIFNDMNYRYVIPF